GSVRNRHRDRRGERRGDCLDCRQRPRISVRWNIRSAGARCHAAGTADIEGAHRATERRTDVDIDARRQRVAGGSAAHIRTWCGVMPPGLVIVDDHPLILSGLEGVLLPEGGFQIAAGCETAGEGWSAITTYPPDVVLLDLNLPGADGFSLMRRLDRTNPPAVV